ncbi:13363_t:CDS:1, partial [Ambispora leptoticha]
MEKPTNGSTAGNRIIYSWNTQKWEEKDSVEKNNNPPSEVIEEEKKKIRQYLKENSIQKVKYSVDLQVEYTNKKTKTIHMGSNEDRPEFCWIRSYFAYLEEEKGVRREGLFFGQEIDSSN